MWFVLAGTALTVVVIGGIYTRRRLMDALRGLGVSEKATRRVGYGVSWFLFGFPAVTIGYIIVAVSLGSASSLPAPSLWLTWLFAMPFWVSMLVMLQALPYIVLLGLANRITRRVRGRQISRRWRAIATIAPLLAFLVYTPVRILVERDTLRLQHYSVGTGDKPLRIVFLGDLQQDHMTGPVRADEVIELANAQSPDLVLSGGDWINTGPHFIKEATESAGRLESRLGTFSSEGDHENFGYRDQERSMREVRKALADQGVHLLHNEVRWFDHNGKRIAVAFLAYNYIFRSPEAHIRALVEATRDADFSILVTHQFDATLQALLTDEVDLVLAGHTHGGQVNPVVGLWHVPLARVETEHIEGHYRLSKRTELIVTAGVGFSLAPFRYASPASIEVIDLHP